MPTGLTPSGISKTIDFMLEGTQALQNFRVNAEKTIQTARKGRQSLFSIGDTFCGLDKGHKLRKANGDLQIIH